MKIQVLSQSFYPDHSGISLYASEFAFYAAQKGNDVEVLTGFGFYPYWKKKKEDRRKLFATEYVDGVKILRGYIYVPSKPTTFKRVLHEISLLAFVFFNFFRAKKPDVIVVFTTPIVLGFIGVIFKKLYGSKLIINVQDFQLEAAQSLGMLTGKFWFKILSAIEKFSYRHADMVTSISTSMYNILKEQKHLAEDKINLWPNWIKKEDYVLKENEKGYFRNKHNLDEKDVIVAYAGNIGLKQGLEILIDLAAHYKHNRRLKFFVIGQGAALPTLKAYAEEKHITNLSFLPLLKSEEYVRFLNDLDIFFLPQKKTEFDVYFPSKLLGLVAAQKVVLLSADRQSELFKTFETNNIGLTADYGDMTRVRVYIDEILSNFEATKEIKKNAVTYINQFQREDVLDNVLEKMYQI